ncbi:DNA-binding transcriptional LysR family regulator [Actinoplanes lutulentus]|uniref:LysR family transcriptional regulator n=1 Tax=Actinoplanes lutulentus TaxID=1287878 RepID=UPI000DB8FAE3|nr:LysR family transcriptional regulator [Actinoplanes lutulentus]MBB2940549.1 DNA-binding transcriptional LysR family regulator [Actinoplanes lutulentus]
MELRQLEYFVAVAEEGSFTKGARRVRVAQSAVSATIQKLERELGLPVFAREAAGVTLTDAGAALLPEARGLLSAERRARDTVDQVRGGLRGTIRIGTLTSIGVRPASRGLMVVDLPQVLGRFHVTHPLVTFQLRTSPRGTAGHLESIVADELDMALVGAYSHPDRVKLHHLGTVPWCFVCPRRHRLADATSVSLEDLADETFVDFPPGWGNRTMTDRAFAGIGIVRNVPFEAADQETAVGLVRNGLGVTLAPRAGNEDDEALSVIDIADESLRLPIAVATASDRQPSAATTALLAAILRAAGKKDAAAEVQAHR